MAVALARKPTSVRAAHATPALKLPVRRQSAKKGPVASLSHIPVSPKTLIRRKCAACTSEEESVSPQLKVGSIHDPAEREADAVADQVMRNPLGSQSALPIASSPNAPRNPIRMKEGGGANHGTITVGGAAASAIDALGSGQPMPASDRQYFEPRFGHDLSHVRIHNDNVADTAASNINARAFTRGSDIVFARGEYGSNRTSRRLMAHELAHVEQNNQLIRRKCKDKPPSCTEAKFSKTSQTIFKHHTDPGSWQYRAATKDCYRPADIAESIKEDFPNLYTGILANYANQMIKYNEVEVTRIRPGDCFAFLEDWVDPKIGDIDENLKDLNKTGNVTEKNHIIAVIYAEQSLENESAIAKAQLAWDNINAIDADLLPVEEKTPHYRAAMSAHSDLNWALVIDSQREYIFNAMLLRIKSFQSNFGSNFKGVVNKGTFHGMDPKSPAHKNNYLPALEYLEGKTPKKSINKKAIDRVKWNVENIKEKDIPNDAGPYYFHWWSKSTAEKTYNAGIAAGDSTDLAEKKAAYKHAKDVVHASMDGVTESTGWKKKIPGLNRGKANERIGSMYVYD